MKLFNFNENEIDINIEETPHMIFVNFKHKNKKIYVNFILRQQSLLLLDTFGNFSDVKQGGNKILCFALKWFKNNKKFRKKYGKYNQIELASVPHHKPNDKRPKAEIQKSLDNYYKYLGFIETDPDEHYFQQNLDVLYKSAKCSREGDEIYDVQPKQIAERDGSN